MSWKPINNATVLRGLVNHRTIGMRIVGLDAQGDDWVKLMAEGAKPEAWRTARFGKRYDLMVMDTNPASVVVFDGTEHKPLGAYVWTGAGGPIPSSTDSRVIQLADALEAYYRGEPPPADWQSPEQLCSGCGVEINTAVGGPAFSVDVAEDDKVRKSMEKVSFDRMLLLIDMHCTEAQVRAFNRLVGKKGYDLVMLSNIRVAGGPAIGQLCPMIEDKFGQCWMIAPSGAVERMEDDDD